ncbi:type IV pilus secretin family protein [Tepidiphilus margaritifer]|uniref:type IV pilus secretin family protein n=1 Tax=Tepidiphilus margaritifer TaxID=203471 RepID=UPI000422AE84|nr:type IV pilus secretin family protein [Tepidiphilus margaritifer]
MIRAAGEVLGFEAKRGAAARWMGMLVLGMCLMLLLAGGRPAMAEEKAALLKDISLVESGQGGMRVDFVFEGSVVNPSHFALTSPSRIVIDFPNAKSQLGAPSREIKRNGIERIYAVEAAGRLRVVLALSQPMTYRLAQIGSGWGLELEAGTAAQMASKAQEALVPYQTQAVGQAASSGGGAVVPSILSVDFRRGTNGEGKVMVHLSTPEIAPDLRRAGERIEVVFPETALPQELYRRSDVTDFATPVQSFRFERRGRDTVLVIEPKGNWQHTAYQADALFVVDIQPVQEDPNKVLVGKPQYKGERLTLNFQNIDVRAVLQVLADFSGFNIVVSDTVQGTITLRLVDVPWDQALDIILQNKKLDKRQQGNVIWVAPAQEIAEQEKVRLDALNQSIEKGVLVTESFQINYHSASEIYQMISNDNTTGGSNNNTKKMLSDRGMATFDMRTNKLFITDVEERLQAVRELLKQIDVPPRQVVIEARILEVSSNFNKEIGARLNTNGRPIISADYFNIGPISRPFFQQNNNINEGQFSTFALSIFNRSATRFLNLELNLAEVTGKTRIVSNPKIMTANNIEARIAVGQEIPYVTTVTANNMTSPNVQFKEAVLELRVTPVLTPDGRIRMKVVVHDDQPDYSRSIQGNPPIRKREVVSDVLVDNGGTIVLGGLFQENETNGVDQVPWLGDVPVFGNLFRNKSNSATRTELMVFLTPRIVAEDLRLR